MDRDPSRDLVPADLLLDCVWRMDLDLRITYVSPVAESMLGIPAPVLTGSLLADHTTPEDHARLRELLQAALTADDRSAGLVHETRVRHADGRLIPFEVHSRLLLDERGQPRELVGVARDISGRRERERRDRWREQARLEEQKLQAVTRLAAGVLEELRPLVASLAPAAAGELDPELAERRRRAAECLHWLALLAGRQDFRPRDLDVDGYLAQVLTARRATLPDGIQLVHQPGAGGSTVWADPAAVERLLRELVDNAAAALGGGGLITVQTGLRAAEPDADRPLPVPSAPWIVLEVRDTGPGFDHATRERILEPFFTTRAGATGLGLALVHGIVKRLGGRLEIESRPGQGSCFRALLPARFADDILAGAARGDEEGKRPTVLLVDDDPDIRHYCERVLRSGGYAVISCADGAEALAHIAGGDPLDAVVLDWALPGLDGRRVWEQITRREPELPVLVISGHSSREVQALGGVDTDTPWLTKPFTPPALLAAVGSLLPTAGGGASGS